MPHILAPVPEQDRCPKNPPDGGHMLRVGPMSEGVAACAYCGAKKPIDERKTVEELAIELLTTSKAMTHGEQDARRLLAELRKVWLHREAEALRSGNTNWTDDTASVVVDEVADWLNQRAGGAS